MSMKDFPPTPFPDGIKCKQQNDFTIEVIEPTIDEGRCEVCRESMSTVIFDVGNYHHHLCRECFEKMMRTFAAKSYSVLLRDVEIQMPVSVYCDFK